MKRDETERQTQRREGGRETDAEVQKKDNEQKTLLVIGNYEVSAYVPVILYRI